MAEPTPIVRELETLMARIRVATGMQLYYDAWDAHGKEFADAATIAEMDSDLEKATADQTDAKTRLEARVVELRRTAPEEIAAWVNAHLAYLEAFLAETNPDDTGAFVAKQELAEWNEVRLGTRTYVKENNFYIPIDKDRYRKLFGIDP